MNLNPLAMGARMAEFFIPFLFALSFHEFAHGMVAKWKGDRTAESAGRLTLNPFAHADLLGTFILPTLAIVFGAPFFGWAKPVPVNERNLRNPKWDMFWIALAGPLSNILLAFLGAVGVVIAGRLGFFNVADYLPRYLVFQIFIELNLFLALFNLIPIHPLDGGKVFEPFLPHNINRWLEDNQMVLGLVILAVFLLGGFKVFAPPIDYIASHMVMLASTLV